MKRTFSDDLRDAIGRDVAAIDADHTAAYPGESPDRQPVHTVYGGAQLFRSGTAQRLGSMALAALDDHGPDPDTFADAIDLAADADLRATLYSRVRAKLEREAVEDFRIDFEDGYGNRPDDEEDATAVSAAAAAIEGMKNDALPPFIGIRIKALAGEAQRRAVRTLDLFVTQLAKAGEGSLPDNFVVTLPKVTSPTQVKMLVDLLAQLESANGLAAGSLKLEIMVETPQSILAPDGSSALYGLVDAADGRCVAAHFGVYDYTASCGITAQFQSLDHPACDFARHHMQVALAGTGVWLSDGATNVIPVGSTDSFHDAWKLHYQHCRHSLRHGFYQGWDLNPAQLPTRYAAVYAFFLESLAAASERLHNFVSVAAQATLVGDVFDDAATGQGLLNFFLRGVNCGAITEEEATATGLTIDEFRSRSFAKIVANRRG
ncbi:MAG: phosphoenolpyruvate kinase [Acidobacteria bacterium]|nr:phosphoenolpyruvate kinase [Acidobacteriota bacterium]